MKSGTRGSADPILAARTVAALMGALDDVYGWHLPRTAPAGSTLAALWAVAIVVVANPQEGVRYRATATEPYVFAPPLPGSVVIDVDGSDGSAPNIRIQRRDTTWPHPSSGRREGRSRRSATRPRS